VVKDCIGDHQMVVPFVALSADFISKTGHKETFRIQTWCCV